MEKFGIDEFLPAKYEDTLLGHFCNILDLVCKAGVYLVADEDINEDNCDRLPVILSHFPSGTSTMDMEHWG